ncbi:MAG: hypothetical protein GYA29_02290 [Methanothrix sp.]|nr:hypothetical protein [Methanothrix sp.]
MDEDAEKSLKRPIEEPAPSLFIDASYFKVRTDGRYVKHGAADRRRHP